MERCVLSLCSAEECSAVDTPLYTLTLQHCSRRSQWEAECGACWRPVPGKSLVCICVFVCLL